MQNRKRPADIIRFAAPGNRKTHTQVKTHRLRILFIDIDRIGFLYEGENETYIEASAENSGSTLYDKEIRDKPRTRHTKRNV